LSLEKEGQEIARVTQTAGVETLQTQVLTFEMQLPPVQGSYLMKAEITLNGEKVFSVRDIPVE